MPKDGVQSEAQMECQAFIESMGGVYVLARSGRDAQEALFPLVGLPVPDTAASIMECARASLEGWEPPF